MMSKKLRIVLLLQSVIFANWALSKLINALQKESIQDISGAHAILVITDDRCALDDVMDGTRESLKSWNRS